MICPKCNEEIADKAKFCTKWGANIEEVTKELELKNVIVEHARAEEIGSKENYREKYDYAVSRAVANLSTLSEYLIPAVKVGGKVICMKGSQIESELKEAEFAISELRGTICKKEEFYLPNTDMKRNIIVIEKQQTTPQKYPRKAGMPAKQPLTKI